VVVDRNVVVVVGASVVVVVSPAVVEVVASVVVVDTMVVVVWLQALHLSGQTELQYGPSCTPADGSLAKLK